MAHLNNKTPNKTPATKKALRKNSETKLASGSSSGSEAPSFGMLCFGVPAVYTFCAKTCLNVLTTLSTEDVDFEYDRLRLIDSTFTKKVTKTLSKEAAIKQYLIQIVIDIDQTMNSLTAAANLLSCSVNEECEKAVKNLAESALTAIEEVSVETKKQTTLIAQLTTNLIAEAHPLQNLDTSSEVTSMPHSPVRLLDCDLSKLTLNELSSELNFDLHHPGGRGTTYFGFDPCTYGRTSHPVSVEPLPPTLKHV